MRIILLHVCIFSLLGGSAVGLSKPHVVSFGKAVSVKWFVGVAEDKPLDVKIRPLYVDTRLKEFTIGPPHEVTDRLFVVRRIFRLNDTLPDTLPDEPATAPRWRWQRGGWLLVDRLTGRVTSIALPEFDPYYSAASWYRDYVAYCGVSEDGKKTYAIVAQVGRRKAVLKEPLKNSAMSDSPDSPDSSCPAPAWQRQPARVTFHPAENENLTYTIRGHAVEMVIDKAEEDEEAETQ